MENINTNNKRVVFKLKHWEGITLFKVIEQEGIKIGCGLYTGSNGWKIIGWSSLTISEGSKIIYLKGLNNEDDNYVSTKEDKDKSIYNSILETFKELGSQDTSEPKFGDKVLVSESDDWEWQEKTLVHILPKEVLNRYICVISIDEMKFNNGERYNINDWRYMKPLKENSFKEISEDTFEVTF